MIYGLSRTWPCTVEEAEELSVEEFYQRWAYLELVAEEQRERLEEARNGQH